ncbi:MAG: serine O-acetyltransferase [Steroidobacterales bacterium]
MPDAAGLDSLAAKLIDSYRADRRALAFTPRCLPTPDAIERILQDVLALVYPGYFGRREPSLDTMAWHIGAGLADLALRLEKEIGQCLRHSRQIDAPARAAPDVEAAAELRPRLLCEGFLSSLPQIREQLLGDAQAAFDGDPAATSLDEVILAYPGMLAVSVYRIAHALHALGVPMMPRIMTEWAHSRTGCDIHPAAEIGAAFFIDHATGVVIGATAKVGARVRLYQGVTLGALSLPRDSSGQVVRGNKRHPTVEDGVTIYANATVLGGQTVIGADSVIGGSVFITRSVAPRSRISLKEPDLRVASRDGAAASDAMYFDI